MNSFPYSYCQSVSHVAAEFTYEIIAFAFMLMTYVVVVLSSTDNSLWGVFLVRVCVKLKGLHPFLPFSDYKMSFYTIIHVRRQCTLAQNTRSRHVDGLLLSLPSRSSDCSFS